MQGRHKVWFLRCSGGVDGVGGDGEAKSWMWNRPLDGGGRLVGTVGENIVTNHVKCQKGKLEIRLKRCAKPEQLIRKKERSWNQDRMGGVVTSREEKLEKSATSGESGKKKPGCELGIGKQTEECVGGRERGVLGREGGSHKCGWE